MIEVTQELTFSPHIGDEIQLCRDALVEVASPRPGMPPTWRYLAAGSRGKLIGWREAGERESRAVVDVADCRRRLVVFVGEGCVARAARRS